ncbi:hypothetical protein COCON_G00020190, partial [Conger conger]
MAGQVLEILEDLTKEEFLKLKLYLNEEVLERCRPIPQGRLEDQGVTGVITLMKSSYGNKMVQVTLEILRKISRNDLVERLESAPDNEKC